MVILPIEQVLEKKDSTDTPLCVLEAGFDSLFYVFWHCSRAKAFCGPEMASQYHPTFFA